MIETSTGKQRGGIAVPLLLLFCGGLHPAQAQFLMPHSFVSGTSPLEGTQAKLTAGTNPLSLFNAPGKALGLTPQAANGFFVGASAGQTVRIVRGGVLTTNLGGSGQTVYATLTKRGGLRGDFFYQAGRQNGVSAEPANDRRTDAHIATNEAAFRVTGRLFRAWEGFAGISTARADINSSSTALRHLLPLFGDTTPSAAIETGSQESVAGVSYHGPCLFLFGAAGRFVAPGNGRLRASDPQTDVLLPLSAQGSLWSVGGEASFGKGQRGQLAAFLSQRSARGIGSVTETSGGQETVLGEGHTFQNMQAGSLAVGWQTSAQSRVSLLYSRTTGQFDTRGGGLLAQPLGFSSDTVNRVGYYARASITREETGIGWEKDIGREQNVALSCRYVRFPVSAAYGYSGRLFLLSYGTGDDYSEPSARGFALRARYEIPLSPRGRGKNAPRLVLGLDQIIPLPLTRRKDDAPLVTPPAPAVQKVRTRTRGGWSVSAGVAYPF